MGGKVPDNSSLKRKRPDAKSPAQNLPDAERALYNLIRSKEDMGISTRDMKREASLPDPVFNKSIKSLVSKNLIKPVVNIKNKLNKYFMAVEFEPSQELTGGTWYVDGKFDTEFIMLLKNTCKQIISRQKVATVQSVSESINKLGLLKVGCSTEQIGDIMRSLVFDNEILEVRNAMGTLCYKCSNKGGVPKVGAMASIPCGVCPRINECTTDGIISPTTCVYFNKWLDF